MAYEWAYEHASEIGGDQSKYFSFGGSAGGCIALGVAPKLIDAGKRSMIAGVVSLAPFTVHPDKVPEAFKAKYKSAEENAIGAPILDGEALKFFLGMPSAVTSSSYFLRPGFELLAWTGAELRLILSHRC